jgi:hypothetical protein
MKALILSLYIALFVFFAPLVQAQKVVYTDYAPYDVRTSNLSIVGKVNGVLYTFRSYGKEYFLDAYNDEMGKTATIVLDFFPEKIYNVRFIPFEDKMLVLYQSQEGTRIIQYAAMLNDKGMLQKTPLKIDEKRTSFFGVAGDKEFFSSAVSENRNHIMVYSAHHKNRTLEFSGYWLDATLMKVTKKVKLNYKANEIVASNDGIMSNTGQFFLPVFTLIGSRNFSDEYTILSVTKEEGVFRKSTLNIGENYLEYPFQKIDNTNGKIHFASFYSTKKNGNNEGVAAATFDINGLNFATPNFIPFDDDMRGESGAKRRERALNDFKINQLVIKNDGGFVVAAEETYITTQSNFMPAMGFYSFYYTPVMSQSIREYHYNDILLLSYNSNNQKEWHTFLRKEQYSQEDAGMFSSYSLMNTGGGLGFLFNDFDARRSRIQLSSVSSEGKVNIGYMDAGAADDPDWLPRLGKQVDSREIVVPCLRKKQLCFAKIVL